MKGITTEKISLLCKETAIFLLNARRSRSLFGLKKSWQGMWLCVIGKPGRSSMQTGLRCCKQSSPAETISFTVLVLMFSFKKQAEALRAC